MKKEWAMKWTEALRSGRYKQGRGALKKRNTFCCLGVLCDLSTKGLWKGDGELYYSGYSATVLPTIIAAETELKTLHGSLPTVDTSLIEINDNQKKSFDEIADVIEMFWEEL